MQNINTKEYWDKRFSEDWQTRGGEDQSRFFSKIALESFPVWLTTYFKKNDISFCDWGCAFGDGTKILKQQLQIQDVVGIDISTKAIETARQKYPDINFQAADFISEIQERSFDIIFSSNTLEHFENPWDTINTLSRRAKKHLLILIPFEEKGVLEEEHYYSFELNNIPLAINDNFSLSFYKTTDTSKMIPSYWNGKQILLIYSTNAAIQELKLNISEITSADNGNMKEQDTIIEAYKEHIKNLDSLLESQKQIAKTSTNYFVDSNTTLQSILKDTSKSISVLNNLVSITAENQLKLLNSTSNSTIQFETIQGLKTQLNAKELETEKYKKQISAISTEFDDQKVELNKIKAELDNRDENTEAANRQNDDLKKTNLKLDSLIIQKNAHINNLEDNFNLLKEKVNTSVLEIEHLKTESKKQTEKIFELEKKLLNKQIELNNVYDKYGILTSRFYELLNSKSWKLTNYIRLPVYLLKKKIGLLKNDVDLSVPELKETTDETILDTGINPTIPILKPLGLSNTAQDIFKKLDISQTLISDQKNILLLVQEFVEGGLERVVLDLAIRLKKENFNTSILVAGKSGGWLSKEAHQDGIPVFAFDNKTADLNTYLSKIKVDVLLINHCYFGLDEFKKKNVPVLEIIHNVYFWQKNNASLEVLRKKTIDKYIAVSKSVFDYSVKHLKIQTERIQVINNGLNPKGLYRPHIQLIEKIRSKKDHEFIFIHLAAIRPSKCHTTILSAFKTLKSKYPFIKLWFAGNIDDPKLFASINDYVSEGNLSNDIQYLGTLNRKELSKKLLAADAALLPSSYEGFSIASLEYMFFGLPQILTNVGAANDIIDNSDIGIVIEEPIKSESLSNETIEINGRNPSLHAIESLASAMEDMIRNKDEWKKKGLKATEKIDQFLFNSVLDKYVSNIQKLTLNDTN
jgi:glycosyltransferase involved in cell wall biosynthesis/ubiquinone/menaquinone biosynthesis C-methylase UbiE